MGNYPLLYLKKAFGGRLGRADTFSGIVTALLLLLANFNPWWGETVNTFLWLVPVVVFGLTVAIGLVLAPYLIHRDDVREIKRLEGELGVVQQGKYEVSWVKGHWHLYTKNMRTDVWEDESDALGLIVDGHISVTTIGTIQVESVSLVIGGDEYPSNWQSESFYTSEERNVDFKIPKDIQRGTRTVNLVAVVDGKSYQGKPFTIYVPEGKQAFRMEGSQL